MQTIVQLRDDVRSAFDSVLKCADSAERRTFNDVEAELWTGILALGRALVALYFSRQAARL